MPQLRPVAWCALLVLACSTMQLVNCLSDRQTAVAQGPSAADVQSLLDRDYSAELPRIAPVEPADVLGTFHVAPGFRIELAAAEPLVADPVAMSFDADGRLYVVEMIDYSEQEHDFLGQVRRLEDTDSDGRFDRSTVFLDHLSWPTAVLCYDGGVYVGAAPDILYAKDLDGDGRADLRETVFTGFERSNVQGLMNTLLWGLDNRIHGATSSSGADLRPADQPDAEPLVLRRRDFAFDPRTGAVTAASGGGQYGMSFDEWGRKFVCSNSDHVQQVMFEDRYLARNPYIDAPPARVSIAADGPQAEVYRASPVEPWRIVRTRLRVAGAVKGPIEGGGRAAGYFTGATGLTIYRGDAWPAEFAGLAIVGDVGSNLIHRKRIEWPGLVAVARRIDEHSEFVASTDIWFRPAQFANAPDGCLYVADVYREVIEHPKSLPELIKKHLDLTSGRDRGRIYRIVPDGYEQRPLPKFSTATTGELVAALAHPNGWHRETASRLLYERQDTAAIEPLVRLAAKTDSPAGRMQALYALDGLGALTADVIVAALADRHPRVREHAVRLAERVATASPAVRERLYAMVGEDDLGVRYQLAFTLGEFAGAGRNAALARLARRDAADSWMRFAVASSLVEGAGDVFARLMADGAFRATPGGREMLSALAVQIGRQRRASDVAALIAGTDALPDAESELAGRIVRAVAGSRGSKRGPLDDWLAAGTGGKGGAALAQLLRAARETALDRRRSDADRKEAIATLALGSFADAREPLVALLEPQQPQAMQLAALGTLARLDDPQVTPVVLDAWPRLSPRLRNEALEALFARPARLDQLLDAVEEGAFAPSNVDPGRVALLTNHPRREIRERAAKLFAGRENGRRQKVVEQYRAALSLDGDADRGRLVFRKICAACHRAEENGYEIGPNLATIKNRGAEAILLNVLDPSREVNPEFLNYVVVTNDGRTLSGIIAAETATSITLKRAESQTDTILRVDVDVLQSTGLSIMPEGVEKDIDVQGMADLVAYLLQLE